MTLPGDGNDVGDGVITQPDGGVTTGPTGTVIDATPKP